MLTVVDRAIPCEYGVCTTLKNISRLSSKKKIPNHHADHTNHQDAFDFRWWNVEITYINHLKRKPSNHMLGLTFNDFSFFGFQNPNDAPS